MSPGNPAREVIEAVARAIKVVAFDGPTITVTSDGRVTEHFERAARAAIEAHTAALAAAGSVVVPREPTDEMFRAYHKTLQSTTIATDAGIDCWRAMVAAALPTPTLPPAGDE